MLDKLKKALEGKEIDFDINALQSDIDTLKKGYNEEIESTKVKSQKIGQEILLKELKSDLGFEYEQRKNPENLKKAYAEKFGLKDAPANEDIEAITNQFTKQLEEKDKQINSIKVFQLKDGEIVKNELRQNVTSDAFASSMMLDNNYIKKAEGGRLIGDETKGGKYSMDEFIASQEAQGVNVNSQEFAVNMDSAMSSGTLDI